MADPAASDACQCAIDNFLISKQGAAVPVKAFYQIFEWVEGAKSLDDLRAEIKANPKAYDWDQKLIIARELMLAVTALHKVGVIHSDIHPRNFILVPVIVPTAQSNWRITGLDFAVIEGQQAPWHRYEGYVGTPGYFSPEHLANSVPTKASDVFSCALILSELLGDGHPAASLIDTYDQQVKEGRLKPINIQSPKVGGPDLSLLNRVLNGALSLKTKSRPTASRILTVLSQLGERDPRKIRVKLSSSVKSRREKN